jgi:hypothetical protein
MLINAGYTPDDRMIGCVQGAPGTPPGPAAVFLVWISQYEWKDKDPGRMSGRRA